MTRRDDDWFVCPHCGAEVRGGATACPECGSDDETGWSPDAAYDDLDLPPEAPSEDVEASGAASFKAGLYALTTVVLLVAFVWALGRGVRLW